MPSVATSFFLPPTAGTGIPAATPAAAHGFGLALANAVPAIPVGPTPPIATVALPGLTTPATLTVLNDIAPPPPATAPAPPAVTQMPAPTVGPKSLGDIPPAILVVSDPQGAAPAANVPSPVPAPAASPVGVKAPPAIPMAAGGNTPAGDTLPVIEARSAAPKPQPAPAAVSGGGEPISLRPAPRVPAGGPASPMVAQPAQMTVIVAMQAPPVPAATEPVRSTDAVGTPARAVSTDAIEKDAPLADTAPLTLSPPPPVSIVVAAAARAELPAAEAPAAEPVMTVGEAPAKQPTAPSGPVIVQGQEPRVIEVDVRDPGLLRAQEHATGSPVSPISSPVAARVAKSEDAPDRDIETEQLTATPAEVVQAPALPLMTAITLPKAETIESARHAATVGATLKAPVQAVAAAAGPPPAAAPDPAGPAPTAATPAPVEFAARVAHHVEPRTAADSAPTATGPDALPSLLAPAPSRAEPSPSTPREAGTVAAQSGKIGHEMGVIIARHAATGGGETITVRLDPKDMGRIDVSLSFDDDGRLRAVVAADNPAALDLLRRDSADLNRALADAGVRADPQSLRFDTRSGGGEQASSGQSGQRRDPVRVDFADAGPADTQDDPDHHPRAASGRIDMMA